MRMRWLTAVVALVVAGCGGDTPAPASTPGGADGTTDVKSATELPSLPDLGSPPDTGTPGPGADGVSGDSLGAGDGHGGPTELPKAEDAGGPCDQPLKPLGCACLDDAQCDQPAYCVAVDAGRVCATACVEGCPTGYACIGVTIGQSVDKTLLCLPQAAKLCQPCENHGDCQAKSDAELAACLDYGAAGRFCGVACLKDTDCPTDYACVDATLGDGSKTRQCQRTTGACACNPVGTLLGMKTTCTATNAAGTCSGVRACVAAGLEPCSAKSPAAEVCNQEDDDCNGKDDDLPATATCLYENAEGKCPGVATCANGKDVCLPGAKVAAKEACNGKDDDCDGEVDEGFPDTNANGVADCVDLDCDGDGLLNDVDNCKCVVNVSQDDLDGDALGDACDPDIDNDSTPNEADCDPKDHQIHPGATELCNGKDDDCDTEIDEALCDDANPCTTDACNGLTGKCVAAWQPNEADPCDDLNPCTTDDTCVLGTCQGGTPLTCPSSDPCLPKKCTPTGADTTSCEPTNGKLGVACEDGNPCTKNDACNGQGVCLPGALQPACVSCSSPADCNDQNPCTLDTCNPATGTCVHQNAPNGTPCDADQSGCTKDDACQGGFCVAGSVFKCPPSALPCVSSACVSLDSENHACKATPKLKGAFCDDGEVCTLSDECDGLGSCGGTPVPKCCTSAKDCDDQNVCTLDTCNTETGKCGHGNAPDTVACDFDQSGCTVADHCASGSCVAGTAAPCTVSGACHVPKCVSKSATEYTCESAPKPMSTECNDNVACTVADACDDKGVCKGLPLATCCATDGQCADSNPCTLDKCDVGSGKCTNDAAPNGVACDADQNGCTQNDSCQGGTCTPGAPKACTGATGVCQIETCVSTGANTATCQLGPAPTTQGCNDNDTCTTSDQCTAQGTCVGLPVADCCHDSGDCGDANPCTQDLCQSGKCLHPNASDGSPCDADQNGCTKNDACKSGVCQAGTAVACPGSTDPCKVVACVSGGADTYTCSTGNAPSSTPCSDGLFCTTGETCSGGLCGGGAPRDCGSSGNACQPSVCNEVTDACGTAVATDGTPCDDQNACTESDACVAGACTGGTSTCVEEVLSVGVTAAQIPAVAAIPGARYVVNWVSNLNYTQAGSSALRVSDAYGSRENEEVVLNDGKGAQRRNAIAVSANGDHLVLATNGLTSGSCTPGQTTSCGVPTGLLKGFKYSASGVLLTSKDILAHQGICHPVNGKCTRYMTYQRDIPIPFSDGSYALLETSRDQDQYGTNEGDIKFYPLGADLTLGTKKILTLWTAMTNWAEFDAKLVPDGANKFIVTWIKSNGTEVNFQRYLKDGTADYAAVKVAVTAAGGSVSTVRILTLPNSRFTIFWEIPTLKVIQGQRFYSDGSPLGSVFKVNQIQSTGTPRIGEVAAFSDYGFVVAWDEDGVDGAGKAVRVQRFKEDASLLGTPITVNAATTTGDQQLPGLAVLDTDEFVVAFADASASSVVKTRRFLQDGSFVGGQRELRGNTTTIGAQLDARAATSAITGRNALVFESPYGGDTSGEILLRVVDATGVETAAEARLNTTTAGAQVDPRVVAVGSDSWGFTAVWTSAGQDGNLDGIVGRILDNDGKPTGGEFVVNQETTGNQRHPALARLGNQVLAAWTGPGPSGTDVRGRLITAGDTLGAEASLNVTTAGDQGRAALAGLVSGQGFVVVYESAAATGAEIRMRTVSAALEAGVGDSLVASNAFDYTDQRAPAVTVAATGKLLVCWDALTTDVQGSWDVLCRVFKADLTPETNDFRPHGLIKGFQRHAQLSALPAGNFLIVWDTENVDTTGTAVELARVDATGKQIGPRVTVNRTWTQNQSSPFITRATDTSVLVGWESEGQDGDLSGITLRVLPIL